MTMKRLLITLVLSLIVGGVTELMAQGWLKRLGRKVEEEIKERVEDRVVDGVGDAVDGAFDEAGEAISGDNSSDNNRGGDTPQQSPTPSSNNGSSTTSATTPAALEATYAKCDFVPGDEIIFEDNLTNEQLGEFPMQWDLNSGNAEVVNVNGVKAICLVDGSANIMPLMSNPQNYLPDVFTLEMDVFVGDGSYISEEPYKKNQSRYIIYLYSEDGDCHELDLYDEGENISWDFYRKGQSNLTGRQVTSNIVKLNDWNHLAFSFNKRAFKGYINGTRVINIPNVQGRPVRFEIYDNWSHHCNDFITNIRIAKGAVPLYDRMISDGKFITYGITFDVGKSTIKPESMGEINRIVQLMTENPELKFSVEGHTDNTGNPTSNQTLSEARAKAIVDKLVELGIAPDRLSAVGKGQTSPIADNTTDEGRAKNRRVEFVKQ